jgi:hypothetical protein
MPEPHEQFKSMGFTTAATDGVTYDVLMTFHFGTSNAQRGACNRRHEVRLMVARDDSGELQADVTWHADFGATIRNTSDPPEPLDLTGIGCANQADIQGQSASNKLIAVGTGPADPGLVMYYPWRQSTRPATLGVQGVFLMNTPDLMTACKDMQCSANVPTGAKGASIFGQFSNTFGIRNPAQTGNFCTDALGEDLMDCAAQGAVPQYLRPGINLTFQSQSVNDSIVNGPGYGSVFDGWYTVSLNPPSGNASRSNSVELEQSIQGPN